MTESTGVTCAHPLALGVRGARRHRTRSSRDTRPCTASNPPPRCPLPPGSIVLRSFRRQDPSKNSPAHDPALVLSLQTRMGKQHDERLPLRFGTKMQQASQRREACTGSVCMTSSITCAGSPRRAVEMTLVSTPDTHLLDRGTAPGAAATPRQLTDLHRVPGRQLAPGAGPQRAHHAPLLRRRRRRGHAVALRLSGASCVRTVHAVAACSVVSCRATAHECDGRSTGTWWNSHMLRSLRGMTELDAGSKGPMFPLLCSNIDRGRRHLRS